MTAREKFKVGDLVFINAAGWRAGLRPTHGKVAGFSNKPELVRVKTVRSKTKTGSFFHMDFLVKPMTAKSADELPADFGKD